MPKRQACSIFEPECDPVFGVRRQVSRTLRASAGMILAASLPLWAAEPPSDGLVRDFSADRPSRSFSPFTVPGGYSQVEMDFANYAHSNLGGPASSVQTLDPVLKYGVAQRADVAIQIGGYQQQWSRANGTSSHTAGFGDITGYLKINLLGDNDGDVILAAIPYVKIPTATANLGNGRTEYGVIAPLVFNLPHKITLGLQAELDVFKNLNDNGTHGNAAGAVNVGFALADRLSGFVELYGSAGADAAVKPAYTADFGLAFAVTPTLALDAGTNIGLNRNTPNLVVYAGIAKRF